MSLSALASAGSSLIGGILQNRANKDMAGDNRDFQERLSSTAYQRAMADMKTAGLNPILAGSLGGASTPGGSVLNMGNPVQNAVNTGMEAMKMDADIGLKNAQEALSKTEQTLRKHKIPTQEAISTVMKNVADLFKSADEILDNKGASGGKILGTVSNGIGKLYKRLADWNVDMKEAWKNIAEYLGEEGKQIMEKVQGSLEIPKMIIIKKGKR